MADDSTVSSVSDPGRLQQRSVYRAFFLSDTHSPFEGAAQRLMVVMAESNGTIYTVRVGIERE
ncbi:MAG: hypothetical protein AB8C46_23035 [Burkholderiaceae bacterium]